jgi:diamine N-acetyltransferase
MMNGMESTDHRAAGTLVALREIGAGNRDVVESLRVAAGQERFVDGVRQSLAEAEANPQARPWYRAIYAGGEAVGFVMLADDVPPGDRHIPFRYYLWRMLIDARFQGRGYGRAALDGVVAYLKTRPAADALVTSVVEGEGSPMGFYLRYGFRSTDQMFDHERVLRLRLDDIPSRK